MKYVIGVSYEEMRKGKWVLCERYVGEGGLVVSIGDAKVYEGDMYIELYKERGMMPYQYGLVDIRNRSSRAICFSGEVSA